MAGTTTQEKLKTQARYYAERIGEIQVKLNVDLDFNTPPERFSCMVDDLKMYVKKLKRTTDCIALLAYDNEGPRCSRCPA